MRIVDLIKQESPFLSLEFFPPKNEEAWPSFFGVVEKLKELNPLFASVTYGAGGGTQSNSLEIARRLKQDYDLEPLAHLTSVGATSSGLTEFVSKLEEAGIENILALRGDAPKDVENFDFSAQEFQYATDLVTFLRSKFKKMCVGVACYPEAHPESPSVSFDLAMSKLKCEMGGEFMVTQLFFDNRIYFDFVDRMKSMGVNVPVIPGVLPIMSIKSAKFILSLCGASIPGSFLSALEKAHDEGGDDKVYEVGMAYAIRQAQDLLDKGAPGVHLYTLNRAKACLEIGNSLKF
ncbi:methylenetetrahydrofolate reductase [NAD(P)H] [Pseudodesulfovibrio senegalensis]|uniref:Methylenetetrahydrofolate reductase n=1 Tax=Pseudodesulfovibrio senegalensis TaxID=1721087 RepID=A0A6N6N7C2_9BACT|nr:methylenetetrahydrofolate reductase [NAD(P)H] [Pseudodesulfovibrio senegalensis]KAB1443611.1 methylenetetrahydrofolate reductase [NAD(P)H] [Pseudodesulfovibrio senegalensis]